jgi:hypothetical protein
MKYKELSKKLKEENSRYKIALLNIVDYGELDAQDKQNYNFILIQNMHSEIIRIAKDALRIQ